MRSKLRNNVAMRKVVALALVASSWLMASCSSSSQDPIVGSWKATIDVDMDQSDHSAEANAAREIVRHPTLVIRADHSYEMILAIPIEGTWQQSGNRVDLAPTGTNSGTAINPALSGTLSDDKKTLTLEHKGETMTFTK